MPGAICQTCNRLTNSAVSNYHRNNKVVTECEVAVDDETGKWVEGCKPREKPHWMVGKELLVNGERMTKKEFLANQRK